MSYVECHGYARAMSRPHLEKVCLHEAYYWRVLNLALFASFAIIAKISACQKCNLKVHVACNIFYACPPDIYMNNQTLRKDRQKQQYNTRPETPFSEHSGGSQTHALRILGCDNLLTELLRQLSWLSSNHLYKLKSTEVPNPRR